MENIAEISETRLLINDEETDLIESDDDDDVPQIRSVTEAVAATYER